MFTLLGRLSRGIGDPGLDRKFRVSNISFSRALLRAHDAPTRVRSTVSASAHPLRMVLSPDEPVRETE